MNPLISVIVPCYNQAQYMDESLQSVLEQSYENWECIIVNDGSHDNTEVVGLKWQGNDERFVYVHKENGGLCSARNYGIELAKGKYILPLDCDDKITKEYIKLGLQIIERDENIGVVYSKAKLFGAVNRVWIIPNFDKKQLLCENMIYCSSIFRKKDWEAIGGYDEKMRFGWEDWEFWINLIYSLNKTAYRLNYYGFYYRQKDKSMVTAINEDKSKQILMYDHIYFKHKKIYDDTFDHPIEGFKKKWRFANIDKILILYVKKILSRLKL